MSRRWLSSVICLVLAAGSASADEQLLERLRSQLQRGALRGAELGVHVVELDSGRVVLSHQADRLLVPASLTKLFTTAAALKQLSPQYVWRTELLAESLPRDGELSGDLYLKGYGDPSFVTEQLWLLVDRLARRGVRRVSGSLVVDDGYFDAERYGSGWGKLSGAWYHAPHGALSFNHNAVRVGGRYRAIKGDPGLHTGEAVLEALDRLGIVVVGGLTRGTAPSGSRSLAAVESMPLGKLVADLNKFSNNLVAEQMLKTLGAETQGAPGTTDKGLVALAAQLERLGIEPGSYTLADGSGLSKLNRVSARQVVTLLQAMAADFEVAPEFRASLKVAGVEGSSPRFGDSLCKRNLRVKTGHLSGVNALAGYARDRHGHELAFAVISNQVRASRGAADRAVERVCELFLGRRRPPERQALEQSTGSGVPEEAAGGQ